MSLPIASTSGVDLDDLKLHLNITGTDDDTELQDTLEVAEAWVATQVSDTTAAPVRRAIMELARHLWETQRGPAAGPLDEDGSLGTFGFAIPNRVSELLRPYLPASAPTGSFPDARQFPDQIDGWTF